MKSVNSQSKVVRCASIVAKVSAESLIKLKADNIADGTKWVCGLGITKYVDEFLAFVAQNINPKELSTSMRWFAEETVAIPEDCPLVRLNLAEVHTSGESVEEQTRPQVCFFFVQPAFIYRRCQLFLHIMFSYVCGFELLFV